MTDRLAELGALQYAVENLSTAGTNPNRLGLAGYIHAAYTDYQAWAAANPGVNPNRLSARGRLYGYFYDHASWSPSSLFAASEVGAWYDPSDLTTMFQDRAGTTPVTADGQTVGKILDKSGRGNHATAPNDAARPLYKTDGTYHWLQFDGVDDSLSTAAIDFTVTDKMSVFTGIKNNRNSPIQGFITLGTAGTEGNFLNWIPGVAGQNIYEIGQLSGTNSYARWTAPAPPYTVVLTESFDLAQSNVSNRYKLREDGVQLTQVSGYTAGTAGVFKNADLEFGSVGGGNPYSGNIYSLIVRGALSTTDEITNTETWVNQRTGAY